MIEILRSLAHGVENMTYGEPDATDAVSAADVIRWAVAEIELLREERRWVPVFGEIIDIKFSSENGTIDVYFGCPKCNWEGQVTPMDTRPKCRCGIEWDFSVSAVGEQPLPPGPEGG
jgi:hypothetical protein